MSTASNPPTPAERTAGQRACCLFSTNILQCQPLSPQFGAGAALLTDIDTWLLAGPPTSAVRFSIGFPLSKATTLINRIDQPKTEVAFYFA
jgi:hypothetical protein